MGWRRFLDAFGKSPWSATAAIARKFLIEHDLCANAFR
jgi:hypothetical protein